MVIKVENKSTGGSLRLAICCNVNKKFKYVKVLQSHPPITETFRFCLIVYFYNIKSSLITLHYKKLTFLF